jgi:hypothetical protein
VATQGTRGSIPLGGSNPPVRMGARVRPAVSIAWAATPAVLTVLAGCQSDMDVLCAVNMRAAERALGQAQSPLARSHYEVARRACPEANLRGLARQIDQVDRASASFADAATYPSEHSPEELLHARALEAERLGSVVVWAARACRTPPTSVQAPSCHKAGGVDAGWCDALTQQGLAVRYRERNSDAFRWTATFPPSVGLDCALFGVAVEIGHRTEPWGGSTIERSHCRLTRGPFDGLELFLDSGPRFRQFSLFSREFTEEEPGYRAMRDAAADRAVPLP